MSFIIKIVGVILLNNRPKYFKFVLTSLFVAIIFVLALTPLGFINLGGMRLTTVHVPVILGSILLGPKLGVVLGATFGLVSLLTNTLTPGILSFVFSPFIPIPGTDSGSIVALVICFVPRILVGVIPYFVHRSLQKFGNVSFVVAALVGSLTNTLLVLHFIYFFFHDAYSDALNIPMDAVYAAIMAVIATNGIAEAMLAALLVTALGKVLYSKIG